MVEGDKKEGKPDMEPLLCARTSFSMPCIVGYVTIDCLHTQVQWGTKARFTQ